VLHTSACYAGKQNWASAAQDAKECIKVNPSFIKGYYRLANAQLELNEFDAALATTKQGLAIEPDNPQLQKQMRQIKAKRSSLRRAENLPSTSSSTGTALPGGMMPYRNLDSSVSKEVMDLQLQLIATTKEYRMVKANIMKAQNGKRSNELTKVELEKLPQGSNSKMYRSVGKMFMLASRGEIMNHLKENIDDEEKEEKDLSGKLDYLERRMKSQQQNIQELTKSASSE
jgi:chaperonin cofactor prefoldin